jgi:hypothetical protein
MSDAFFIFTTTAIGKTEFAAFLKKAGGVLHPDDPERGRVSQGRSHVWIFLSHDGLNTLSGDVVARVTQKLGALPRSDIVLELSSEPGTEALVTDVAIAFAELWPALLSDLDKMTLTLDDLRRARRDGTSVYALAAGAG